MNLRWSSMMCGYVEEDDETNDACFLRTAAIIWIMATIIGEYCGLNWPACSFF